MPKVFKFENRWGEEHEIEFVKCAYAYGGHLAIAVNDRDEFGEWEAYAMLTVNLADGFTYLDSNNVPDLCRFVLGNGWAEVVGERASGFCVYPRVEFTDEFLNRICKEGK